MNARLYLLLSLTCTLYQPGIAQQLPVRIGLPLVNENSQPPFNVLNFEMSGKQFSTVYFQVVPASVAFPGEIVRDTGATVCPDRNCSERIAGSNQVLVVVKQVVDEDGKVV